MKHPFKNHRQEIRLIKSRIFITIILMMILLILLVSRLVYLQIIKHDFYNTLSTQNQMQTIPLAPTRGLIYDLLMQIT